LVENRAAIAGVVAVSAAAGHDDARHERWPLRDHASEDTSRGDTKGYVQPSCWPLSKSVKRWVASVRECHPTARDFDSAARYGEYVIIRRPVLFAWVVSCVAVGAVLAFIVAIYVAVLMAAAQVD
jgi:ribosomal protein S26